MMHVPLLRRCFTPVQDDAAAVALAIEIVQLVRWRQENRRGGESGGGKPHRALRRYRCRERGQWGWVVVMRVVRECCGKTAFGDFWEKGHGAGVTESIPFVNQSRGSRYGILILFVCMMYFMRFAVCSLS